MSAIRLKYGETTLELEKSPSLVGLQTRPGRAEEISAPVSRIGARMTHESLGGFDMVDVEPSGESMESALDDLRTRPEVNVGTHVYYTSDDQVPFVPTGEVYVQFSQSASIEDCNKILEKLAVEIVESRSERECIVRVTSNSPNPVKVALALQESGLADVAEPELATPARMCAFVAPSDNLLQSQWHLHNSGSIGGSPALLKMGADARVVPAWKRAGTLGVPDVTLAVIDDGFDLRHPDLSGPGKIVAPWDFTGSDPNPSPGSWPQYDWHGTACAGVAVGNANGTGIVGAAPGCRLMPVRWGVDLADRQVENWFGYVQQHGAWVVSCSWGAAAKKFALSSRAFSAIRRCARNGRNGLGCVVLFAAGNDNHDINDPANGTLDGFAIHPDVIAVAASTSMDKKAHYSNFGDEISVCAPSSGAGGRGILTSDVMGKFVAGGQLIDAGYGPGAYTWNFGGTSSACPLAAGVCALLLSVNPNLRADEVKAILERTARKIGPKSGYDARGHSREFGYGCVNAEAAIHSLVEGNGHAKKHSAPGKANVKAV